MRRRRVLTGGVALAAVTVVGVLVAVLLGGGRGELRSEGAAVVVAEGLVEPRVSLFGDTVTATVVATLNPKTVDPGSVRVTGSFSPFKPVGQPKRVVKSAGDTTTIETAFVLRCLTSACVPGTSTIQFEPEPARLEYAARPGSREHAIDIPMPSFVMYTRLDPRALSGPDPLAAPWRADLVSLPATSYRVAPGLAFGLLLAVGGLLVLGGAVLGYRMLPRRPPPPEPVAPPEPELSAIERALAVLESPAQVDGVADRRRALELIADEATQWGDHGLSQAARRLAWSHETPEMDAARVVAASVRAHLEEQGDGRLA